MIYQRLTIISVSTPIHTAT
jgi:hypothetical protein